MALILEATSDPENPADVCGVTMHDMSEGGIAFWSRRQFPFKKPVYVREYRPDIPGVWLVTVVTHCTTGIRGYLIGAEFDVSPGATPGGTTTQGRMGTEVQELQ